MKKKILILNRNNALLRETSFPSAYKDMDNVLVDPDLTRLKDVDSWFLCIYGNKVIEMLRPDKIRRLSDINQNGLDYSDPTERVERISVVTSKAKRISGIVVLLLISLVGVYLWQM